MTDDIEDDSWNKGGENQAEESSLYDYLNNTVQYSIVQYSTV